MLKTDCLVIASGANARPGTELEISLAPDWLDAFVYYLESDGCNPLTIKAYLGDVRAFAVWFAEENRQAFAPDLLTGVDLRAYRRWALENKVAPATFNRRRIALARLVAWARAAGGLSYDPLAGVKPLAQVEPPLRWLNANELHRLLRQVELMVNAARSPAARFQALRNQAVIALLLYAGLREAEVSSLDLADLAISERKGRVTIHRGKGDKRREAPLNSEARRAVKLYLELRGDEPGALFAGKRGGSRLGVKGIQVLVAELRRAAGLDDHVTPHALRHTFAKRLVDGGAQLTEVQRLLGHTRLDTTARYTRPGWEDLENAVEKF